MEVLNLQVNHHVSHITCSTLSGPVLPQQKLSQIDPDRIAHAVELSEAASGEDASSD